MVISKVAAFAMVFVATGTVYARSGAGANERTVLERTLDHAAAILQRPECSALFGEGAAERLRSVEYRFVALGKPVYSYDGTIRVIAASTVRDLGIVMINRQGPFVRPRMMFGFSPVASVIFNFRLADADYRALLLLHEFGHIVGRFQPDGADPSLSSQYSKLVLQNCF